MAALTPGPWLIFPGVDSIMFSAHVGRFTPLNLLKVSRPLRMLGRPVKISVQLGLPLRFSMPAEAKRIKAIDKVISRLAHDFLDTDWSLVEQLAGLLGHLLCPPSTSGEDSHIHPPAWLPAMRFGNLQGFSERSPMNFHSYGS